MNHTRGQTAWPNCMARLHMAIPLKKKVARLFLDHGGNRAIHQRRPGGDLEEISRGRDDSVVARQAKMLVKWVDAAIGRREAVVTLEAEDISSSVVAATALASSLIRRVSFSKPAL